MVDYTIQVRDKDGTVLGEFDTWKSLSYSKRLNNYGEASFLVPWNNEKLKTLTALRRYEVYIYRNNTLVWAGEQALRKGTLDETGNNWIQIQCYDFIEMLNHRITAGEDAFDQVDAGEIAEILIDDSQALTNGDLGITIGTIEPTKVRDRTYAYKPLMEAIIQLSQVIDGFDFELTDEKVFNVYTRKGSDLSQSLVFEWGTNMKTVTVTEDFTTPVNEATVLGSGSGAAQQVAVVSDTIAQGPHKLRQARVSYTDVSELDNLEDKGQAVVNKHKQPILSVEFVQQPGTSPAFGSVRIGDIVRMKIIAGIYNINAKYRVYGYNIDVGDTGEEYVRYNTSAFL